MLSYDAIQMTKLAAKSIYCKNPLKFFFAETRGQTSKIAGIVAFWNLSHNSLFIILSWVDLDLFYDNVKFCKIRLFYKKVKTVCLFF